jgi:colanic acid/amylovoran biosynthesis glycosyltransferase
MLHIYRQITGLKRVRPVVIAQKRANEKQFPLSPVYVVGKPPSHLFRRLWHKQLRDEPWQLSRTELSAITSILQKTGAQLLHIYFGHIAAHLLPLIRTWPNPTVVSFHGADVLVDMHKPGYRKPTMEMLRLVRRVLVRSESLRRGLIELGCESDKIDILRAGIPLDEFRFRPRHFPEGGEWRLVQACRLIEKKGLTTSLRAFARFAAIHPASRLTIAGEGPMLEPLQSLAAELNIGDKVTFPGFVPPEQLRQIYYQSHIFLHPSHTAPDGNQEGVPNSMLEAMATGLPVFATTHGGIPEAIDAGVSGILVAEHDDNALGRALLDAVQDRQSLARLAEAGAAAVRDKFDRDAQVRKLEEVYLRTISAAAPAELTPPPNLED